MGKDALRSLTFGDGGSDTFIKFEAGKALKLRVFTTNPVVSIDNYGNTRFSFVVWDWEAGKAKILSKGASIARPLSELHNDEDYGADITKVDIKIIPSGDGMERRYNIQVLPKANNLSSASTEELQKLEDKLETIIKNGVRADRYNEGERPEAEKQLDEIANFPGDEDAPLDLNNIPF